MLYNFTSTIFPIYLIFSVSGVEYLNNIVFNLFNLQFQLGLSQFFNVSVGYSLPVPFSSYFSKK